MIYPTTSTPNPAGDARESLRLFDGRRRGAYAFRLRHPDYDVFLSGLCRKLPPLLSPPPAPPRREIGSQMKPKEEEAEPAKSLPRGKGSVARRRICVKP
jgi:hypothetical protein